MSPSACKSEFSDTTRINNTVPENIIFVYSRPSDVTSFEDPINKKTLSEKKRPKKVNNIEMKIPK